MGSSSSSRSLLLERHEEGVVLAVAALPGARRNEVRGVQNGALKVSVTQVAERGKATKAVLEELARFLKIRKSQVELLGGETSRHKRVLLRGIDEATIRTATAVFEETGEGPAGR